VIARIRDDHPSQGRELGGILRNLELRKQGTGKTSSTCEKCDEIGKGFGKAKALFSVSQG